MLILLSHIKLRLSKPDMPRPYKTPGGIITSSIALVLAVAAVVAGFVVNPKVWFIAAGIYVVFIAYFFVLQPLSFSERNTRRRVCKY